jgi:hypothetical protein
MQRLDDFDRRLKLIENSPLPSSSSNNQQIEEPVPENNTNDDLSF